MEYFSEYGEDRWIDEHLVLPANGVYVDIGAADPVKNSNTAFLRSRGWTGLAVDGNPGWSELWPKRVTDPTKPYEFECDFVSAVLSDGVRMVPFNTREHSAWWLSRIEPGGTPTIAFTLEQLLRARHIEHIDFLSIDVEGAEFDVLQTLDWAWHRPAVVVAEYNTQGIGEDYRVRDLLSPEYTVLHQTVANLIYINKYSTRVYAK